MPVDVWIAKHNGKYYCSLAKVGEPPMHQAKMFRSLGAAMRAVREKGVKIHVVGICDPMMLGI